MKADHAQRKYLDQYRLPDFTIETTELEFILNEGVTTVRSRLKIRRLSEDLHAPLRLDGVDLKLVDLQVANEFLDDSDFSYDGAQLTIPDVPHEFDFCATVEIDPDANTRLEGLYRSSGNYCTQCEAEGFRCITFYIDRPDVMSVFTTIIRADKKAYPVLLSNGNKLDSGVDGDRHWVKWHDPYPKPSYLFAMVAGDLACVSGTYQTASGRDVTLQFYTEHHNKDQCGFALRSLQNAMRWDEQTFGLEYDLDLYMVVAVDDFNMGAMENKGLNVFNTQYVLANPQSATDSNYLGIEGVIGHEYFHNWTGNRVTCRDWFQLSLKEGLTVFRDQEFSADMQSRAIQRISDVRALRSRQFAEDAGPMAHPVRPSSYVEINNFYTATVYEKGAEVVRMYQSLLGKQGFRKGMDLYFERHDGQAVTTDDFRNAMADANNADLDQFQRWYEQAGTPQVMIQRIHNVKTKTLKLRVQQQPGKTRDEPNQPFHIPMKLSLFDQSGAPLPLNDAGDVELTLDIREADQTLEFANISELPLISALREFSAPIILKTDLSRDELAKLMVCETDPFNQWEAAQQFASQVMLALIGVDSLEVTAEVEALLQAWGALLDDDTIDAAMLAEILSLPDEKYLAEMCQLVDVHKIHQVREFLLDQLATRFERRFKALYDANQNNGKYEITPQAVGQRRLKNSCLGYLTRLGKPVYFNLAQQQFEHADNMTDQFASLQAVMDVNNAARRQMLDAFYQQWRHEPLVLNKWFSLQAASDAPGVLDDIIRLAAHPDFNIKNPNRVRSLLGPMQSNSQAFHDSSGRGYAFYADKIIELDTINPLIASRLVDALLGWQKLIPQLGELMKQQIQRIQQKPDLSDDVAEKLAASLAEQIKGQVSA